MNEWAVVVATFVGPIMAVLITLWYQDLSLRKSSRMHLFSTMMRLRRDAMNQEFVGALNVVPLHFHNKKAVIARYRELMAVFDDNGWESGSDRVLQRLNEKVNHSIAVLLSEMSKVVGTPIEQLSILNGAYSPRGWVDDAQINNEIRQGFRRLLTGHAYLPVVVVPPSVPVVEQSTSAAPQPVGVPPASTSDNPAGQTEPSGNNERS